MNIVLRKSNMFIYPAKVLFVMLVLKKLFKFKTTLCNFELLFFNTKSLSIENPKNLKGSF